MEFELNHTGNAEVIAHVFSEQLKYDVIYQRWIAWDKERKRWVIDTSNYVLNLAAQAVDARQQLTSGKQADAAHKWNNRCKDLPNLSASLKIAQSLKALKCEYKWDSNPLYFQVENGLIELATGTFRKAKQDDAVLKVAGVQYDEKAECPQWMKFLSDIFVEDALIEYVQKAVGYSLTGSVKEQCLFACHGSGANGKSTFLGAIAHIFGEYGCDLRATVLESYGRNLAGEGVELPGARFAKCEEVGEGEALNSGRIKSWTGENEMVVRPLYKSAIHFPPTHKLWLTFNNFPEVDDQSDAIWRRIKLIPFSKQFSGEKVDRDLPGKLRAESSGILNWMIAGCLKWQNEGLKEPDVVLKDLSAIRSISDTIKGFADESLMASPEDHVTSNELYKAYSNWCQKNEVEPEKIKSFIWRLRQQFPIEQAKVRGNRGWSGIKMKKDG
jgi:putative DNA primase/helicase